MGQASLPDLRPLPGGTHGALVASVHPAIRRLMFNALDGERQAVHEVERADDAFLHAQVSRPSVVVADAELAGGYGPALCACLKADPLTRHIAVVIVSSAYERTDYDAAIEAGADAFLNKPFSVMSLRALAAQLSEEAVTAALLAADARAWGAANRVRQQLAPVSPAMRRLKPALHPHRFDTPPCEAADMGDTTAGGMASAI